MAPKSELLEKLFRGRPLSGVLKTASLGLKALYALCFIASLVAFFVSLARLSMSAGNPGARSRALHDILVSGICFAVLGGLGLIFAVLLAFMS